MESVGQKKYRQGLSAGSFYQPPPMARMPPVRPQSEYGVSGLPWMTAGYSRGSSGSGSAEWPPWGTRPSSRGSRRSKTCSVLLAAGALVALLVVLAVAALALYMGAFRQDVSETVIVFEGRLRVRRAIGTGASVAAPAASRLTTAIRQAYVGSPLASALTSAEVHAINNDKNVVFFRLYLDRRKIPNSLDNLEDAIRNILVEDSLLKKSALRQLNVDPMSIAIRRDVDQAHRPESQTGSHQVETKPTPVVSAVPQNAKEKILQTRMGVIRKPAVIQSNISVTTGHKVKSPAANDEPDINEDELPVIQGSFQITKTDADITENKHPNRDFTKSAARPKETTTEHHKSKPTRPAVTTRKNYTDIRSKIITSPIPPKTTVTTTQKTTTTTIPTTPVTKSENLTVESKENLPDYLPKLDTLFAVPTYVDQEPWRPIRPGEAFSTDNVSSILEAEDRLGETELVEDISLLEGIANVEEVPQTNVGMNPNQHDLTYQGIWPSYTEYPPEPVYTSFTDPAFSSTFKDAQTLGMHYPRPHPLPVNKIPEESVKITDPGDVSYDNFYTNSRSNTSESEILPYTPPKDTLSTVAINVKPLADEDKAELVNLNGGVIIKKPNASSMEKNDTSSEKFVKIPTIAATVAPNKTYEGPVLYTPLNKWEYVNGSSNEQPNLKKIPNKTFNETLQAVITQNNEPEIEITASEKNLDTLSVSKVFNELLSQINDSLTNIKKEPVDKVKEIRNENSPSVYALGSSEPVDMKTQELLMSQMIAEQMKSSTIIPTLLPVKSNSGIGRPLRPRPKLPNSNQNSGEERSFTNNGFPFINEMKTFISSLRNDHSLSNYDFNTTSPKPQTQKISDIEISNLELQKNESKDESEEKFPTTISNIDKEEKSDKISPVTPNTKKIDINEKFRLPKTHPSDSTEIKTNIEDHFLELMAHNKSYVVPTATEFFLTHPSTQAIALTEKVKMLLRDFEKYQNQNRTTSVPFVVPTIISESDFFKNKTQDSKDDVLTKVHVETSVSTSSGDSLPSEYVTEIFKNKSDVNVTKIHGSDENIAEKLKHLANIATISDAHNTTFFKNENIPDETVISTKAVSSSYTINGAGFKILTKTFNKIPGNFKDNEKNNKIIDDIPLQSHLEDMQTIKDSDNCESKNLTLKCSNGQCLPETARCNRLLDCPEGEDEKGCTCADYLKSQFLLRKICDGVLDCWDFSDENNCEWCKPEQYVCSNSRQCIDKDKICDGQKDCPLGDDEKQCVTVATSQEDASSYPYSKEGYIMVQKHGKWGRLCIQNFDKVVARSHSSLQINDLGRAVCRSMTYNDFQNVDRVIEDEKNKENQYFSLHYTSKADGGRGGLAFRKSGCSRGQVAKVVCSQLQCGARPQAAAQQARIVGGGNAGAGSWPWQAALYKEGDFQCGATLISDRWLISAGHCFYHAQEDFWVARLGALRRGTTFPSPYEQLQPISSVILHPGYIDSGFINDIALLKTAYPVAFSDYVRPICLPPSETEMEDGRRCTVVGWGQLFEVGRIFPDTLQEVELPVISTSECRKRTLFLPLYRITEDMFCAGFDRGGRDACLGDSGGPLMCQEQDNQWYLYGVTSNGYGCARANRPGVYTKVSNYVNWIQTTMKIFDDRSFDRSNLHRKNSTFPDLEVSESRSSHRHVDKCRGHRCPLGECLPPTRVCNGFMECSDGSDESNCR